MLTLKYRPRKFSDLVGQKHVSEVLRAMVLADDLPAALILAGSRGTGKTTSARILAAALNCENRSKAAEPCGECSSCEGVWESASESVLEVDAASNGSVAAIRRLRELCYYTHSSEWRVIMLDEVHAVSKEGFTALLKILEEPPEKTVFVLLTTEEDQILETIRSRSMSFGFRRISVLQIVERLEAICEQEGLTYDPALLHRIASEVDGGLRDAVMLLDQCSRTGVYDVPGYEEMLGARDVAPLVMEAVVDGDIRAGLLALEEHFVSSGDALGLVGRMSRLLSEAMLLRAVDASGEGAVGRLAALSEDRLRFLVMRLWEITDKIHALRESPRAVTELGFLRMVTTEPASGTATEFRSATIEPILKRRLTLTEVEREVKDFERSLKNGAGTTAG